MPDAATPSPTFSTLGQAFLTDGQPVCELVLVRHGQQDVADPRTARIGDWIDPPLSARGERQAERVGRRFAGERVDAVYTSTLRRAYDTGAAIAAHHGLEPVVREDLREVELFRDLPHDKPATESLGRELMVGIRNRAMRELRWDVYPYSEGSFEFRRRVVNTLEAIVAAHHGERVVVACHGGVINTYLAHFLGIGRDMFFHPGHTSVQVVYAADATRSLRLLNCRRHLEDEPDLLTT